MPENRLKSRLSAFQSTNVPRHRAILRRGFLRFAGVALDYTAVTVKITGIR